MDAKILAVASFVVLAVFAGMSFALPGFALRLEGLGMQLAGIGMHATPMENATWHDGGAGMHGFMQNCSWNWTNRTFNRTIIAEQMQQFSDAVQNGDYETAKKLHGQYGFGGPMFSMLNETTFAKYSQMSALQEQAGALARELQAELGLDAKGAMQNATMRRTRAFDDNSTEGAGLPASGCFGGMRSFEGAMPEEGGGFGESQMRSFGATGGFESGMHGKSMRSFGQARASWQEN